MRTSAVVISLILLTAAAWAQPQPRGGAALGQLKTYLSLTDDQVRAIQTIQTNLRNSTATVRQQIATKQQELNTAVRSGGGNATALGQLHLDSQALQKQIADAEAGARPQMVATLNPAQQALLQKLVDAQKLQSAVREAEMAGLITPANGRGGMGMMGMGVGGPGGGGRGNAMMAPRRGGPGAPPPQQQ